MHDYQLYISGRFVDAVGGGRFESVNPATGEPVASFARAQAADVDAAAAAARDAFDRGPWRSMPAADRAALIKALADAIAANAKQLTALEIADSGSTLKKAKEDIYLSGRNLAQFSKMALLDEESSLEGVSRAGFSRNILRWEPVGVVGAIIPWNFPLKMAVWKLGPALAAGNTVVLKPSEETPATAMELARLAEGLGFPPGVINVLTGFGPEAGAAIAAHPLVDKVAFTGSTAVGRSVMAAAAGTLKKVTLECGGKSANIVLEDADIPMAVDGALYAIFYHQGQCCEAGSRLLLPESLADAFVEAMAAKVRAMRVGDPADPATDIGPLVSRKQQERVLGYIDAGRRAGARLVTGGGVPSAAGTERGFFVEPTIFDRVDNSSVIAREEIFGPVLSVIRYRTADDAVRLANESDYGLAGGVWSRDHDRAMDVARRLRAGTVWVNEWHLLNERAPFGGYRQSGIGREFGVEGLREYMEAKHIHVDEVGVREKKSWYDTVVPRT